MSKLQEVSGSFGFSSNDLHCLIKQVMQQEKEIIRLKKQLQAALEENKQLTKMLNERNSGYPE